MKRLRRNHRATLAAKETQTMDYFHTNGGGHFDASDGRVNDGFMEENNNNNKRGTGRQNFNRFKVYHRKLDFSHVGSKVCIMCPGVYFFFLFVITIPNVLFGFIKPKLQGTVVQSWIRANPGLKFNLQTCCFSSCIPARCLFQNFREENSY